MIVTAHLVPNTETRIEAVTSVQRIIHRVPSQSSNAGMLMPFIYARTVHDFQQPRQILFIAASNRAFSALSRSTGCPCGAEGLDVADLSGAVVDGAALS